MTDDEADAEYFRVRNELEPLHYLTVGVGAAWFFFLTAIYGFVFG